MSELRSLTTLRTRLSVNYVKSFLAGSRLRIVVVCSAAVVFWLLMFGMFMDVFIFLAKFEGLKQILVDYLFAFFFVVLLMMMTISNAIICYTSFYRNDEVSFLLSLPAHAESIFIYKGVESILFSAWGMATLVVPLILAYGITEHAPWYFFIFSLLLALVFVGLPMALGAFAALLVPILIPRRRKTVLIALALAAAVGLTIWGISLLGRKPADLLTESGMKLIVDRIAFSMHWALPSYWVSDGMLSAARANPGRAAMLLLMLLSNVLFLGILSARLGKGLYMKAFAAANELGGGRRRAGAAARRPLLERVVIPLLSFLPWRFRLLVLKDLKTFLRDPVQWSQVVLFFGLLALYVLNLPRLGLSALQPYWHSLVSLLNLGATCLTLSTLTSRFVYPQLSLEGRRMWIVGMIPVKRSTLLWGKFFFAMAGSGILSTGLIVFSDIMIGLPGWIILIHMAVALCAAAGLNGLAVGLGAVFPNMRSDDPSKIVSSFGGTLNLVLSICFVIAAVGLAATPLHLYATGMLKGGRFLLIAGLCLGLDLVLAAATCLVPMFCGQKAFERMEF